MSHRSSDLILEVPFFLFCRKPWNSNLLITYIWLNVDQVSPGRFSYVGTSICIGSAGCSGSLSGARHLNAFVTLTFTLCSNFTSDFLTKNSHKGEQLVPITRKAFATWVTAHKKHSWDHQLFYLFFFQFLLIEKLMRYISFPWRSPGKQWSDSPFPACFGQRWWYSTAKSCLIEASSMLLVLISTTKLFLFDGKHFNSLLFRAWFGQVMYRKMVWCPELQVLEN